jgi:hypothetical protein
VITARVFLSYAHDPDSADHRAVVREFWHFLRSHGIDAHLDLEAEGQRQDWSLWMADQIRQADHILVVGSPAYRERAQGQSGPAAGRGVQWEARLIREAFYRDQDRLNRFVPVVLPGQTRDGIPDFLAPATTTVYEVREFSLDGAESLLRLLTRQPAHAAAAGPPPGVPQPSAAATRPTRPAAPAPTMAVGGRPGRPAGHRRDRRHRQRR